MSDSELSDAPSVSLPPDFELENSLRREVNRAKQNGDEPTVRQIRTASEKRLGLPDGYYKSNSNGWNKRSKDIIQDQYDNEKDVPGSPDLTSKKQAPPKVQSLKRKSPVSSGPPSKKRKPIKDPDAESSALSDVTTDSEPAQNPTEARRPGKTRQPASKKKNSGKSKATTSEDDESEEPKANADSESDLSVILDEAPKPKKRAKSSSALPKQKSKPAKTKSAVDDDPDQVEIKRLQGWLVKCGIRKVWGAYLKPYETPKAKIKHLKEMLADVGMTGRFSQEKASAIKEARELAEDIAAVQEGAQRWGAGGNESEEEADEAQTESRGRLQRGRAHYDFLSSDGEETS